MSSRAQSRSIRADTMPFWRVREVGLGIVRAALIHRMARLNRLPIIHSGVHLRKWNGTIDLGHLSEIHDRVVLSAIGNSADQRAKLSIGDYTSVWYGSVISARHEITIGRECAISWNCTVIDDDMHEVMYPDSVTDERPSSAPINIKNHVWIGASAIVLKGVTIGENSIVAANAVVTEDVPPHTLVAGIPAKPIRKILGWR